MQTRDTRIILFLTTVLLFTGSLRPAAAESTVYKNDFTLSADLGSAQGVSARWSSAAISFTPSGRYGQFLGEFGNQTVSLTLTNLPPHREVTVSLSLFILKSWDGNQISDPVGGARVGPDVWGCYVSGGPTLLSTTFSNINRFPRSGYPAVTYAQAFPGGYPGGDFPPGTGSAESNTLGYQFAGVPMDAVYPLKFTFAHTEPTLTLNFVGSSNLQGIADESWGLDNVEIRLDEGATDGLAAPKLEIQPFLVRIAGEVYVVGEVVNRGDSPARVTLRSATLALFDPLEFYEDVENMPLSLGVLAPGEQRSFGARFVDPLGPPGRGAALTLSGVLRWQGSAEALPIQIFSQDFNNLRLP
jgi:hypothetical protein